MDDDCRPEWNDFEVNDDDERNMVEENERKVPENAIVEYCKLLEIIIVNNINESYVLFMFYYFIAFYITLCSCA